jgi:hypothetical protein
MKGAQNSLSASLSTECRKLNLNSVLSFENFKCSEQCEFSAHILIDRFVDTIEFAYSTRKVGQKRMRELATMTMRCD